MSNEIHGKVKEIILKQLSMGASCRIHLHRECCCIIDLEEPTLNRSSDLKFDVPFNELLRDGMIRKVGEVGIYAFYEITKEGKTRIEWQWWLKRNL